MKTMSNEKFIELMSFINYSIKELDTFPESDYRSGYVYALKCIRKIITEEEVD